MKRFNALGVGIIAVAGLAGIANGQISNSKHDFSSFEWSGGEICKPCHTPHFANATAGTLWNHTLTDATYKMFEGEQGTAKEDLDKTSRLCMSCHDGTVALDSFGGKEGTTFIGDEGNLGTDLQNDHPIGSSAIYPLAGSGSFNPADANHRVISSWGSLSLRSWIDKNGVEQWVVGCRTCHDPHNKGNFGHMMKFSNAGSHVCLTCHIK